MSKITQYSQISNVQPDDLIVVVDTHDTSMSSSGTTKNMAFNQLSPSTIGASRSATAVVAASNASAKSKAAADFVCTGTADDVTIQSAIRYVNNLSGAVGGKVILTEGTFHRKNPIYIDQSKLTFEGQGDATQITVDSGASGAAHIIIGSNGAFDGVTYTGGDTAPTALPQSINIRNFIMQDYAGLDSALAGSASGLICRGSVVHTSQVNLKTALLDGIRFEGFRQMGTTGAGTAGTIITSAISTTPAWGTSETWNVSMSSPPSTPFLCIVTPDVAGNYDPEIINVTNVSGTTWTVQRGWMQTTTKTHQIGDAVTVLNVTTTFNNVTTDCFLYSALRAGMLTQQGLDDSEFVACIVNGGSSVSLQYTQYGFWVGGSNCRFIACHPYFCAQYGYYGNPQTSGQPIHMIISGEYESNGIAGISIQQSTHACIEGGVQLYANTTYDVILSAVTDFRIHDTAMYSPCYQHIRLLSGCIQGTIHDNVISGNNSGYMLSINGVGPNFNSELDIHDNIFLTSASSYPTAINLASVAGVNLHDNILEQGLVESGTSDYNTIHNNIFTNPSNTLTVVGTHTRAYQNQGISDYLYSTSATAINALSDQFYQLNSSSNTMSINPPGSGAGGQALNSASVGVTLPVTTITLNSAPATWPSRGQAIIPVTGGVNIVNYLGISGNTLTGCSGGTGFTVSGNAYICPDPSLRFQVVAPIATNAVTILQPPGMTINGLSSNLALPQPTTHVYTAVLGINQTSANWAIY